jgi:sialic acid synthase
MPIGMEIKRILNQLPSKVKIGKRYVGPGEPVFMIAEIGNNHNGDLELAKEMIVKAKEAGCEAVKFQKRTLDQVFTKEALDAPYNTPTSLGATYGEHRAKLEIDRDGFLELKMLAKKLDLVFFCTPFDHTSVNFLEDIGVDAYKIASFDVTNIPLLEDVAKRNKPIILSTGMSSMEEVDEAVETILKYNNRLVVLHCVSVYPTPDDKLDLSIIPLMKRRYAPLPIGYSGHETDFLPTLMAASMGAHVIERHFTLAKDMKGPDHKLSLTPEEMTDCMRDIRRIEVMMGDGSKEVDADEFKTRAKHSKSLVTAVAIPAGTTITIEMITIKSPGSGLKPNMIHKIVGKTAQRDLDADTLIPEDVLGW